MKTTLNLIRANNPCADSWEKLLKHLGKIKADNAPLSIATIIDSNGLDDAIWCLRAVENHDREMRLFAVWCARQVQHLMTDPRSIAAIDIAERFANGLASLDELHNARVAARAAAAEVAWNNSSHASWDAAMAAASNPSFAARPLQRDESQSDSRMAALATTFLAKYAAISSAEAARAAVCSDGEPATWSERSIQLLYHCFPSLRITARAAQEAQLRKICAECDSEVTA